MEEDPALNFPIHESALRIADEMATYTQARESEGAEDKCSVCLGHFKNPKVLPCCHTFCEKCLRGILRASSNPDLRPQRGAGGWGRRGKSPKRYEGVRKGSLESSIAEISSTSDSSTKLSCPQCRKEHEVQLA